MVTPQNPSLEWRLKRAADFHSKGYNCAQSVLAAFPDVSEIPDELAMKIAASLGSGVGASGELCGVPNAMGIVVGLADNETPGNKKNATIRLKPLLDEFKHATGGLLRCADLKTGRCPMSCNQLIDRGIKIIHEAISSH